MPNCFVDATTSATEPNVTRKKKLPLDSRIGIIGGGIAV